MFLLAALSFSVTSPINAIIYNPRPFEGFFVVNDTMTAAQYREFWFPYAVGFALANLILIVLLIGLVLVLSRTQQLQSYTILFGVLDRPGYQKRWATIFDWFFSPDFTETATSPPTDVKRALKELVRFYSHIGLLVHARVLPRKLTLNSADACVKLWIMSEAFLEAESQRRGSRSWRLPFQFLTILSLKAMLNRSVWTWSRQSEVRFYDPKQPQDPTRIKVYDRVSLEQKLLALKADLARR